MADLIVPKSPIQGGAAAQVRVEANSGGAAIAQFGEALYSGAMKMRNQQDARELSQAQIDMQMGLGQLRQEFDQVSDATVINEQFPARVAEIRGQVVGGLNERLQTRAGFAFDELANRQTLAMGARATALHQDQMSANLDTLRTLAIEAGANADEETRDTEALNYADGLRSAVETGAMTESQAATNLSTFMRDADLTAATTLMNDDPARVAEALRNGEYAGITGTQRPALLARAESAAATLGKQAQREVDAIANNQLGRVITAANQGRIATSEDDILNTPEFRNNPKYGEAQAAVNLRNERPEIARMTPDQLRAAIAEESAKTVANGYDNNRLQAMQSILAEAEKGWRDDPILRAESVGLPPPPAPEDLANADPQELVNFFAARASFADGLVEDGYTDSPVYFSKAERDQIAALTASDQDPTARTELAGMMSAGFGDNAQIALQNIGADPVFTHMAGLIAGGGNPASAEMAFRGQQAIDAGNVVLPTNNELKAIIRGSLASQFRGVRGGDAAIENLIANSTAIYADMARENAEFDPTIFAQALNRALGQDNTASNEPTGGIGEINGADTIIPVGIAASEMQNALVYVESLYRRQRLGDEAPDPVAILTQASVNGAQPLFGGAPIGEGELDGLTMQAVGDGKYLVFYKGFEITAGENGESYILDIRRLIELTDQAGNTPFRAGDQ